MDGGIQIVEEDRQCENGDRSIDEGSESAPKMIVESEQQRETESTQLLSTDEAMQIDGTRFNARKVRIRFESKYPP
jgi:hypothetical protein